MAFNWLMAVYTHAHLRHCVFVCVMRNLCPLALPSSTVGKQRICCWSRKDKSKSLRPAKRETFDPNKVTWLLGGKGKHLLANKSAAEPLRTNDKRAWIYTWAQREELTPAQCNPCTTQTEVQHVTHTYTVLSRDRNNLEKTPGPREGEKRQCVPNTHTSDSQKQGLHWTNTSVFLSIRHVREEGMKIINISTATNGTLGVNCRTQSCIYCTNMTLAYFLMRLLTTGTIRGSGPGCHILLPQTGRWCMKAKKISKRKTILLKGRMCSRL